MDLAAQLEKLEELVREAKSMPLSSSVLVNREEFLTVDRLVHGLPHFNVRPWHFRIEFPGDAPVLGVAPRGFILGAGVDMKGNDHLLRHLPAATTH